MVIAISPDVSMHAHKIHCIAKNNWTIVLTSPGVSDATKLCTITVSDQLAIRH